LAFCCRMGGFRFHSQHTAKVKECINSPKQTRKAAQFICRRYLQKLGSSMMCWTAGTGIEPENECQRAIDGSTVNQSLEFSNTEPHAAMSKRQSEPCTADQEPHVAMLERRVQPCSADQDNFRVGFLSKLFNRRVWLPRVQRPPSSEAVLIFDWDDTLICTTWLHSNSSRQALPSVFNGLFAKIAWEAAVLLRQACQLGRTFIITNAEAGWVEASARQWLPELLPALQHINIISARAKYQRWSPDIHQWKMRAFLDLQLQLDQKAITNVVAVGDADYEMDAAHALGRQCTRATVKTIRFVANPSPQDLLKQLTMVRQKLPIIVESGRNVAIGINRRKSSLA